MTGFVELLPFLLPPLLGAVIGYVTNALAIKMLFRPLYEKRVFGMRLPFTPGIIPRQREKLAQSIGRMVSERLLTEDAVRSHVENPEFRSRIGVQVSSMTSSLLEAVPAKANSAPVTSFAQGLEESLESILSKFVGSENFRSLAERLTHSAVDGVAQLKLKAAFPRPERTAVFVSKTLEQSISHELGDALVDFVDRWIANQLEQNVPMSTYIPEALMHKMPELVDSIYDPTLNFIISWLNRPDVRREIAYRGKGVLRDVLDRLNIFQRFLVSAGQYDRTLEQRMPEIVGDLVLHVKRIGKDPQNRKRVIEAVMSGLENIRSKGIRDISEEMNIPVGQAAHVVAERLVGVLAQDRVRKGIAEWVESFLKAHAEDGLGEVLHTYLQVNVEEVRGKAVALVRGWIDNPESARSLTRTVMSLGRGFLSGAQQQPIGEFLNIDSETKASIDGFLSVRIAHIVGQRLPEIVHTFDIRQLVEDKVNSLDMENVEALLLMVIAKQLRYINIFGALLGSIIGGAQVLVNVLL